MKLNTAEILSDGTAVSLGWADGSRARFHALWLRDNALACRTRSHNVAKIGRKPFLRDDADRIYLRFLRKHCAEAAADPVRARLVKWAVGWRWCWKGELIG